MPTIAYVKQKDDGRRYVMALADEAWGADVRRLSVSAQTYEAIGCPVRGESLDDDTLQQLTQEDERVRALRHAIYLLSYTDNSERRLCDKLCRKGYTADAAAFAVREVVRLGYVREREQLTALVRNLANGRLYGPHRIVAALTAKGYRSGDIRATLDELIACGEVDLDENLRTLEEKKGDGTPQGRRKLQYTYGYLGNM